MKPGRFIFPAFLLITLLTYFPTIGSGFVFDFVGWQRLYNQGGFGDIINCFGYHGNQQIYHLFTYTLYKLFHLNGFAWYLVFCSFHAFNGWLLFQWIRQVTKDWKIEWLNVYSWLACLMFLLHPYAVEAVVFKACIQYHVSLAAILSLLILVPRYSQGKESALWISLGIYFLSLFALEISYVTPLVITIYTLIFISLNTETISKPKALKVILSFWALLVGAVLINKVTLGAWVGHYGTSTHLQFDPLAILSTEIKYVFKHLLDARMWSHKLKSVLFDQILSNKILITLLTILACILAVIYWIRVKKVNAKWHLVFFALVVSLIYTLPVSNLFFYYYDYCANDRFSYVPLLFLWVAVLASLPGFRKGIVISLFSLLILLQSFWQQKIILYWKESTRVLESLKADYRWHDHSHVFVLNSPDNYKGIWMTSMIKGDSGIDELIDYQTGRENKGVMYDIYQFNMTAPNDGVKVEQTGPMQLKVTFNQWGNWWHLHGIGGGSYENEYYKAEVLDYPYQVTFKQFPEGSVIIYQDSMKWKQFEMK